MTIRILVAASLITGAVVPYLPRNPAAQADPAPKTQPDESKKEDKRKSSAQKPAQEADADPDRPLAKFMQLKLNNSSNILRGLMVEDFRLIRDSADELLEMSEAESWRASNDMMYLQHSNQFRNAVAELKKKAGKKSIDGASLAWMNVTMSCIQCHEWVRNIMLADSSSLHGDPLKRKF